MPWLSKRFEERISPADEGYFRERMSKIVYGAQEILCDADGEIFCFGAGPFVFPGDLGFLVFNIYETAEIQKISILMQPTVMQGVNLMYSESFYHVR